MPRLAVIGGEERQLLLRQARPQTNLLVEVLQGVDPDDELRAPLEMCLWIQEVHLPWPMAVSASGSSAAS